jgi:hypothetical protein
MISRNMPAWACGSAVMPSMRRATVALVTRTPARGASTTRSFAIDQKEGLEDTAPADGTFAAYHYTSVASASLDLGS